MPPLVRMIAQAHLDPVWMWRRSEGRAEALATSASAVDRLREYPSLHFVRGEAQVYEWIEQEDPDLLVQIKRLIRAGRWHVVNGMIVQPDMNLPQGESLVRQALLGKRYMHDTLGVTVPIAYCVDSFGHAGTLPQILLKCGFDAYVFMRPQRHEHELPSQAFWWEGPDGSRILTYRIPTAYATRTLDIVPHVERILPDVPPQLQDTMCFFGLGNHGGGPTREQIENVLETARQRTDVTIRFDHPQAYFDSIRARGNQLPVVTGELQAQLVGTYSAHSGVKRLHRQAENGMLLAERLICLAGLMIQRPAPITELRALWHELAFNQFHDILAGTTSKDAADESILALGRVVISARELADNASREIGAVVHTAGPGSTILIFNPYSYPYTGYVEYEPWTEYQHWDKGGWGLVDEQGAPVPHQVTHAQAAFSSEAHALERLVFPIDLPPLGYRLYRFAVGVSRSIASPRVYAADCLLENELLRIELDPATGAISSCRDKATGQDFVGPAGWNVAQVLADTSDTWSQKQVHYDGLVGAFGDARCVVDERGPLQASLLVERRWGASLWEQQLVLRAGEPWLTLRNWLSWQGSWQTVKLAFTLPVTQAQGVRDVPFGALPCPEASQETPMQMWADVTGADNAGHILGLTVVNDGKYACDIDQATLRVTILRSPPYCYYFEHRVGSFSRYDWLDQGPQEFTLVLHPHQGDWRDAGIIRHARATNMPPYVVTMASHKGRLPGHASMGRLEGDELEMTALKPAEDGAGYIVRIADCHGRGGSGRLVWQGQVFPLSVTPYEVLTFRLVQGLQGWSLYHCDMLENALDAQPGVAQPD